MLPIQIGNEYDMPKPFRIKFEKTGMLRFISHLDLCRTMKAVILRSGLPIWYTEGFNPHPKMVFATSLSLGQESVCEFMDFKLTHEMDADDVKNALNDAMPDGLKVTLCYNPQTKFTDIAWSGYEISTEEEYNLDTLSSDTLITKKKTKSGEKEVDIKPQIHSFKPIDKHKFKIILCADNRDFLNSDLIARVLGLSDYEIMRTGVFLADGVTPFI